MTVAQSKLAEMLFYAVLLGLFLGFVYDFFRIRRRWFSFEKLGIGTEKIQAFSENLTIFFEDVLFSVFCAVAMCIFIYYTNSGRVRSMAFVGAGVGFIVYYKTIGRLVLYASGFVIAFIRMLLNKLVKYAVRPIFLCVMWLIYITVGRCIMWLVSAFVDYRLARYSKKGFGILKKREIKNGKEANEHIRKGGNLRLHSVLHRNDHKDAV